MTTTHTAPATPDPAQLLLQLTLGYMVSGALQLVTRLKLADRLADGPTTTAALAAERGLNDDALYRILRALATVGVVHETAPRTFVLTPLGELLRSDRPSLYNQILWITSPTHFRAWSKAIHSLETGEPSWEHAAGAPVFDYFAKDPELSAIFNNAMTAFSAMMVPAVLDAYSFDGVDVLVDVAGGHGQLLTLILQKYPTMRGILTDVDHVIAGAAPVIQAMKCSDRVDAVAVDFFTSVPAGGDAYILKHIIHDWDDDRAAKILGNVRKALEGKPNGRVILLEGVIQPGDTPDFNKMLDLEMLITAGGRERTADEFRALLVRSGFELTRIVPTASPVCVIEATPR